MCSFFSYTHCMMAVEVSAHVFCSNWNSEILNVLWKTFFSSSTAHNGHIKSNNDFKCSSVHLKFTDCKLQEVKLYHRKNLVMMKMMNHKWVNKIYIYAYAQVQAHTSHAIWSKYSTPCTCVMSNFLHLFHTTKMSIVNDFMDWCMEYFPL